MHSSLISLSDLCHADVVDCRTFHKNIRAAAWGRSSGGMAGRSIPYKSQQKTSTDWWRPRVGSQTSNRTSQERQSLANSPNLAGRALPSSPRHWRRAAISARNHRLWFLKQQGAFVAGLLGLFNGSIRSMATKREKRVHTAGRPPFHAPLENHVHTSSDCKEQDKRRGTDRRGYAEESFGSLPSRLVPRNEIELCRSG